MKDIIATIPLLRFPSFYKKWEVFSLTEILSEHKTRNKVNEFTEVFSVAKTKGVINQIEHLGRSYASNDITNYKVVFPEDLVYTKSPTAGFPFGIIKQNTTNRTGVVSVLYGVFKPKTPSIGALLAFYFSSPTNTYNQLVPIVHRGAKNTMNIGNLDFTNGIKLCLPVDENEQNRIALFLSETDNLINELIKKKTLLTEYKKGVTQQIFNKKIRFKQKNGDNFDDWKLLAIEKLLKRYTNPVQVIQDKEYNEIGIRSHGKGIFHKEGVIGATLGNKRCFWIKKDLLTLNIVFAWERAVAKTSDKEVGMIASHRFPMYEPIVGVLNLDYILTFFLTPRGRHLLELASPGGAGRNKTLGQSDFEKLKIPVPSVKEQIRISNFLSELNDQIDDYELKINQTKQYKKALLQNLFCN
jgi:type I restriction enzyme S subunit